MRKSAVNGFGVLGLWSLLAACSGSSTYLNKQPVTQDGGGNSGSGATGSGGASSSSGGTAQDGGGTTGTGGGAGNGGAPPVVVTAKKLDVLIMVDNSSSMSDKQDALARTVPQLVAQLVHVEDLHVGVITSSLGGHGSTICDDSDPSNEPQNDHAHLLGTRPRAASLNLPQGFIEWTPAQGTAALGTKVQGLVTAAGQEGCGLESQLEAIYRFLADPYPPQTIVKAPCANSAGTCATPQGIDSEILAERRAFLRPDSAVAVVLLSDENDCSIRDAEQYYYAATLDVLLPAAATVCSTNPNDACCYSCGVQPPAGCTADPACSPVPRTLTSAEDSPNLRCFEQKRRFGIDFLYPVQRYVNAVHRQTLCTTSPDLAPPPAGCVARTNGDPGEVTNPLYQNLDDPAGPVRDPSMVHVLGIVGAPWQDLAATEDDGGNAYPAGELHYQSPHQLATSGTWAKVLGSAAPGGSAPPVLPTDPHMQESIDPRAGLPGPNDPPNADPINGHDWNIMHRDDLQYACIFAKPTVGPCTDMECDCFERQPGENNPLCQTDTGSYEQVQHYAKAYPGLRELAFVQGLGDNALAASICARNLTDNSQQDYGYRPAFEALATELAKNVK